ncbi:hypothetical protein UFOVP181_97 [uncultured Caudovirales phage]|uniref:Uncharacterized protein n=1 Tax=uncultured Caudovirales phage TaxID=2100421 RepID=A0A6J7WDA2_9CAUD|nr:hypothetical protein UFOVP57_65 [uncultured Caudovirales phage]CAB5208639.1 hypothetical protein UFOVP181_97 [uncultured Caudovirales phage]
MQIREFSQPITAQALNESLAKKFGYKINLEQFSDVQLEDARNKLRTRISQFEMNESFDSVLENTEYQKTRMFLDVLNQAILEREMTSAEKAEEKAIKAKTDKSGMKQSMKKQYGKEKGENVYFATIRKRAMDESIPESWIDSAIERIQLGESDHEELKAELAVRYDINESTASWMLCEGEETKAEIIMATKDMVDRITGWLEDTAAMKAEQLLELQDSIREALGSDVAQQYGDSVKPALEAIYTALETSRQGLQGALAIVSGGEAPTMGAPVGDEFASGAADVGGAELPTPDISGAEEELAATPAPEVGREKRESVDYSRRLGQLLNSKKK